VGAPADATQDRPGGNYAAMLMMSTLSSGTSAEQLGGPPSTAAKDSKDGSFATQQTSTIAVGAIPGGNNAFQRFSRPSDGLTTTTGAVGGGGGQGQDSGGSGSGVGPRSGQVNLLGDREGPGIHLHLKRAAGSPSPDQQQDSKKPKKQEAEAPGEQQQPPPQTGWMHPWYAYPYGYQPFPAYFVAGGLQNNNNHTTHSSAALVSPSVGKGPYSAPSPAIDEERALNSP